MKVLAIIPARAGSKGIPDKNIKELDGKALIRYSIEAALESKLIDKIIVSSDGDKIIDTASEYDRIDIHRRNPEIAGDKSPVSETISEIISENKGYDAVMLLQPTSPLRTGEQIDEAISSFSENDNCNSLISVVPMDDVHPARMYWIEEEVLEPILSEFEQYRRQDIPTAYYRNGSIYMVRVNAFEKNSSVMQKPSLPYVMPYSCLLNIDEPRDLIIGEALVKAWKRGEL